MVRDIDISKLNAAPYNPRIELKPGDPDFEKLKASIEQFGFVEPVVWNERTGNVVGGHQRLSVYQHLGYTTIPCSVVDMSESDEKVLNVALNKIKGEWDYEKLENILKEFDYEVAASSGFAPEEIAVILANNDDLDESEWDDFGEWDDDSSEETTIGGSYVVTLIFPTADFAREWAEARGYEGQVKDGSKTTVIRVEALDDKEEQSE